MFVWLRKKFINFEESETPQHLQVSLHKLTMEVAKKNNEYETVLRTNPAGDVRRRRLNMLSSSTARSIGDKGDNTTPKIKNNNKYDATNILPAVEEIYQYEQKLQRLVKENEYKKEKNAQQVKQQKPSAVMESITKLQDDEIKELFKRKFREQMIKNKRDDRLDDHATAADDGIDNTEIAADLGVKPPDSTTRIWKGVQLKESLSREYSNSFGCITLRDSDLPKYIRETTDTSLDLTQRKASILSEQVNKMKYGMEKLNSVLNSNYTEKYKKDIDFLIANIAPHIKKWEKEKKIRKTKLMVVPEQKEAPTVP